MAIDSIRRSFLALLAGLAAPAKAQDPNAVSVFIGPGKALTVTFPNITKDDLVAIVADLFSRGDAEAKAKFQKLIGTAPSLTLVLKSRVDTKKP